MGLRGYCCYAWFRVNLSDSVAVECHIFAQAIPEWRLVLYAWQQGLNFVLQFQCSLFTKLTLPWEIRDEAGLHR